jgi:hypothetical protein
VVEVRLLADAREHVGHRPAPRTRVERLVGRHQRQARVAGEPHQAAEIALLRAVEVALHLDEAAVAAEDPAQPIEDSPRLLVVAARHRGGQRATAAAGEAHETPGVRGEIVEPDAPRPLRRGELEAGDEPAEVAIAVAVLDEHGQPRAVVERHLATDDRPHAGVLGRAMKASGAVHPVAIDQGDGGHPDARGLGHQRFGLVGAFQERERGLRVKLDEHALRGAVQEEAWSKHRSPVSRRRHRGTRCR